MSVKKTIRNLLAVLGGLFLLFIVISVLVAVYTNKDGFALGDKVGVVKIEGVILDSLETNRQIQEFSDREDIKAVVIRINSPGGAVAPSQEIFAEVKRLAKHKPVVASMGSLAASGGYYIAIGSDKIYANPGTITGSIGVIVEFMNLEELLAKIGLKGNTIKSGKFKDTGSPHREMTAEERALMQSLVDDVYGQFVMAVSEERAIAVNKVRSLADGRIYSGAQARKNGLVDELGGLEDAINKAAEMGEIEGAPPVVFAKKRKEGLLQYLLGDKLDSALSSIGTLGSAYNGANLLYLAKPFY